MKYSFRYLVLLALVSFFTFNACKNEKKKTFSDSEFRLFNLEKKGWKSQSLIHDIGAISYKATLVPLHYYIIKNSPEGTSADQIDSIYNLNKKERIVEVEFAHEKGDDLLKSDYTSQDYTSSVKYMSFKLENDFQVVTSKGDTVPCAGVTFERNFKVAPFKRVLLHFGNVPPEEDVKLLYNDQLFGNGLIKFNFTKQPIAL